MRTKEDNYSLLIRKLDRFIKKYYTNKILKGALLFISAGLLAFLTFSLLESQFYFSTGVRKVFFYSFSAGAIGLFIYWVLLPFLNYNRLGKIISHEKAAEIIGTHFGNVQDKLLNILQLKKLTDSEENAALIHASINQKSEEIKIVPFRAAIDLGKNRKYLKYALPPFMLLLILIFAAPSLITDSTHRIIYNDKEFEKEAPFKFIINEQSLEVLQYDDLTLDVKVEGDVKPNEVFIDVDGYQYRLKESENGSFSYVFRNVQKETEFTIFSGKISSDDYNISVLKKPNLSDFSVYLDYPAYTGRNDESVGSVGDFIVPQGTRVRWNLEVENTEQVFFRFSDKGERNESTRVGENEFSSQKTLLRDLFYKIYVSNEFLPDGDSTSYSINVIPDLHPNISVERIQDSTDSELVYFVGSASDDYGLVNLSFNYQVEKPDGTALPLESQKILEPSSTQVQYDYLFDINELNLDAGDKLSFYFEVFDNDGVNGSKSSRTGLMTYSKASIDELRELEEKNDEEIKDKLEESIEESKKIKEQLKKLKEKLLQKNELDWQDRKELEELLKRQEELRKEFEEAKKKLDENLKNQEEFENQDQEILEKQQKLQEMFEESQNSEMEELMQQIQELLQELEKESALEMMEEMKMNDENMEQNMERLLELYKQLEVEKEAQELINELQELSEEQDKLSQETVNEEKPQEELQEEQEKINEEFNDILEKLDQLEEKNQDLEVPKDLGQDNEQRSEEINEELQNSKENLQKQENNKASQSQKKASEQMSKMAESMAGAMQAAEMEQMAEDIQALRQLLENLVNLSFDQEDLIDDVNRTNSTTPKYVSLVQKQFKLKDDFSLIQDSLIALSKRVVQIETFVTDKVGEIKMNLDESLENLESRQKPLANDNQRRVMKNTNDLAVMLAESMDQMQQQMGSMSGSGSCANPGGSGSGQGKQNKGSVPLDKITEGQEGLGEKLQEMMDGKKQGNKGSSKEFAQAAARQAALRKALEEIKKSQDEQGKPAPGLQELIDQMDKIEVDLVNKRLNNEMLTRQQNILTRLLEAEKAERQREMDEERLAERTGEKERKYPPEIEEYIKKKESEVEMYKTVSPALKPYYKYLVEEYYKSLKENK